MCPALMGSAPMLGGGPLSGVVRGPSGEDHRAERIDGEGDLREAEGPRKFFLRFHEKYDPRGAFVRSPSDSRPSGLSLWSP